MRIVLLSLHTSPAAQPGTGDAGGLNVYVSHVAAGLARAGHAVDIITADPATPASAPGASASDDPALPAGVRLHHVRVDARDKDELAGALDALTAALADHPALAAADLVWAHYWISAAAACRLREAGALTAPVWVSFHTVGAVKDRDLGIAREPADRLAAEREIAASADLLIANTSAEAEDLVALLGAESARIRVLRPGIDAEVFSPGSRADARARLGLAADDLIVLAVGRMQHIKGTDVVIDAAEALAEADPQLAAKTRFVLIGAASGDGAGEDYSARAAAAQAAGARIELRPPVPPADLADLYRAADVVVVASRSESYGFVAAEAASSGAVVCASAVGGLPHIVDVGVSGVLVDGDDPTAWALALSRLLRDPGLRQRMSSAAVARSADLGWDVSLAALEELLEETTDTREG